MKLNIKEMRLLSKITNSFYEDLKIEYLFHSNHLEGSTFTRETLLTLLKEKKVDGFHNYDDVIETNNSLILFDKVIEDCGMCVDKFMLFEWHRILKKGSVDEEIHNAGMWKKYENRISGKDLKLALPHEVDGLVYNLIQDWNESGKLLEDIVKFHYRFEKIHPFQDGNGRLGRFLILKQCVESDIDLIAIDCEYEKEYKDFLYLAQKTDNVIPLIEVFEKCQERLNDKMGKYVSLLSQVHDECQENTNIQDLDNDNFELEK